MLVAAREKILGRMELEQKHAEVVALAKRSTKECCVDPIIYENDFGFMEDLFKRKQTGIEFEEKYQII